MNYSNVVFFFDQESKNTLENAKRSSEWLNENKDIESIILVAPTIIYLEVY